MAKPEYNWIVETGYATEPQRRLRIMVIVCRSLGVTVDELKGLGKTRSVYEARMIYSYIMRKHLKDTFQKIALELNRDHSSIVCQVRSCEDLIFMNDAVKDSIENIEQQLLTNKLI